MIHPILLSQSTPFIVSPALAFHSSSWVHNNAIHLGFHHLKQRKIKKNKHLMSLFDDDNNNHEKKKKKEGNQTNNDNNDDDDDDDKFLQDFSRAKSQKFGMDIPTSSKQIQESIESSQNEFLNAMKQAKEDFQKSKEDVGVDGAIELLKQNWDEEDKLWELQKELEFGVYDSLEDDDDDDAAAKDENSFQLVFLFFVVFIVSWCCHMSGKKSFLNAIHSL